MTKRIISITMVMVISLFTLTGCNNKTGQFYTIKEAYESGIIGIETVKHIFYYAGVPMYTKSDRGYEEMEFTPKVRKPSNHLSEKFEEQLRQAYYKQFKEELDERYDRRFEIMYAPEESVHDLYNIDEYYGRFGDVYAMAMGHINMMMIWYNIGEIYYYPDYRIMIYKYNY